MRSTTNGTYRTVARRKAAPPFATRATCLGVSAGEINAPDPVDFFNAIGSHARRIWSPNHELIKTVLEDAFFLVSTRKHRCTRGDECPVCEILTWLSAASDVHSQRLALRVSYTFEYICSVLDLDPDKTRAMFRAAAQSYHA